MTEKKYADFAERLTKLIDSKGTSIKEISDKTGINYEMVRRYANGMAKPREDKMGLLANFLETSITYLDYGDDTLNMPAVDRHTVGDNYVPLTGIKTRQIPVLNRTQAGRWREYFEDAIADEFEVIHDDNGYGRYVYALVIQGFSMFPDFKEGDIVYVDPDVQPRPSDYVVALKKGDKATTFKKYRPRGFDDHGVEYCQLIPSNPDFPIIDSRHEPFEICAVAIEVKKKLR